MRSAFEQAPIGTYTGWNPGRKDRFEGGQCNLPRQLHPIRADASAERLAAGDPRLSIEERYPSKDAYLAAFRNPASTTWSPSVTFSRRTQSC